jgi:alpha-1,6-mannosyltransferase
MKTMHITNSWSETSGGIATFYGALMDAANRRCQSMSLVVPGPVDGQKMCGEFARIYEIAAPKALLNRNYRMIYPRQFLAGSGKLRKILNLEQPDLVEVNDKYALIYFGALLRRRLFRDIQFRPVVVGLSCERMDVNFQSYLSAGTVGRAFCSWYMRNLYFPFFDHHIAISDTTADELLCAGLGHEIARGVFQLPLGVDCRLFSPQHRSAAERSKLLLRIKASDSAVLLLYVGRLAPEKNLSLLLDTMAALSLEARDYRLIIAGDGMLRDSFLKAATEQFGQKVVWLGHFRNRQDLARLYANCDFFLHPNPQEPFGIAPLEAMASGIPLIAPNSGGLREYANPSNAGLTEATGRAFASRIRLLAGDGGKRRIMIASALRTARKYSLEAATNQYLDLYEKLVKIAGNESPIETARPVFVSQPPSRARKTAMSGAAGIATWLYLLLSGAWTGSKVRACQ